MLFLCVSIQKNVTCKQRPWDRKVSGRSELF